MAQQDVPESWKELSKASESASPESTYASFAWGTSAQAESQSTNEKAVEESFDGDFTMDMTTKDRDTNQIATLIDHSKMEHSGMSTMVRGGDRSKFVIASDYTIEKSIARGGMGTIYLADQKSLQRKVAIKKINPENEAAVFEQKFIAEARVTSFLDHPNIVPIYDLGQKEDDVFISMKLVEGKTWKQILHPKSDAEKENAQNYDFRSHLEILLSVCNAIDFAHSKGVLHNDLKSENIMIGRYGEVLVMDWGLAIDMLPEERHLQILKKDMLQHPMGTPCYIAPELALGEGPKLGPWTDVYLLGAILYEILTGKPPHYRKDLVASLSSSINGDIYPLDESHPLFLRQICEKALAYNPEDRYATVGEFKQELDRYLEHRESMKISKNARDNLSIGLYLIKKAPKKDTQEIYRHMNEAISGFRQALLTWKENQEARKGLHLARIEYARFAFANGDLGAASSELSQLPQAKIVQDLQAKVKKAEGKKARQAKLQKQLKWGLAVALYAIIIAIVFTGLWMKEEQQQTAVQYAEIYARSLGKIRQLYSSNIVSKVKNQGILVTHEYGKEGTIPFPATFSIDLATSISAAQDGIRARLYSDYPFPWRKETGGARDQFEHDALRVLRKDPSKPYIRTEKWQGRTSLRYAAPVQLKEGCISCHNTHSLSPKTDWKAGEVRGVQEIIIPLDIQEEKQKNLVQNILISPWFLGFLFIFTGIFIGTMRGFIR